MSLPSVAGLGMTTSVLYLTIELDLTHQILSEILHLNRVTVSRLMSNFANAGAVEKIGRYYVLNLSVVEILLDGGTNCTE